MPYQVLLVDDETPALRYMQAIIDKYLPDFSVVEKATTGAHALAFLREHPAVDVLMTDISMPGMNGIELAQQVRVLNPCLHIVIVSGYAEFDYARGAINVAADDYLLKPLNVSGTVKAFRAVADKLALEHASRFTDGLCLLLAGKPSRLPDNELARLFHFALLRWGNLSTVRYPRSFPSCAIPCAEYPFTLLRGADEDERIIIAPSQVKDFPANVAAYASRENAAAYTAVLSRMARPLSGLNVFQQKASVHMEQALMIGRRQMLYLEDSLPKQSSMPSPLNMIRSVAHFAESGNLKMLKETFINMAAEWESKHYTQLQVKAVVYPLVQQVILCTPALLNRQEQLLRETDDLLRCASSCGSLAAGLFDLLFNDSDFHDKRLSPAELCGYAVSYIRDHYAKPISVQTVCTEIGVSQTYLSRLLRRYADTSFSVFLTQCRIEAAVELIRRHPDILLRDVAACVGYDDPSYFSKVFHQATGKTPTQFAAELTVREA